MFPNIFENAKVGDLVFWTMNGWCKILNIYNDEEFPVLVGGTDCNGDIIKAKFTLCGRLYPYYKFPTLFPEDKVPQYYLDLCPRPKRKVKKTLEIWVNIFPDGGFTVYNSKKIADDLAVSTRIACIKMIGEYEEEE